MPIIKARISEIKKQIMVESIGLEKGGPEWKIFKSSLEEDDVAAQIMKDTKNAVELYLKGNDEYL